MWAFNTNPESSEMAVAGSQLWPILVEDGGLLVLVSRTYTKFFQLSRRDLYNSGAIMEVQDCSGV